jgi:UDP-N-acetyl-D-galactosamine dehydrogenase
LILGVTFKEDCPDIRNSKVIDIVRELQQFNIKVDIYDPHADKKEVEKEYAIKLLDNIDSKYDAIVLAVSHAYFLNLNFFDLKKNPNSIIFDLKGFLDRKIVDSRL